MAQRWAGAYLLQSVTGDCAIRLQPPDRVARMPRLPHHLPLAFLIDQDGPAHRFFLVHVQHLLALRYHAAHATTIPEDRRWINFRGSFQPTGGSLLEYQTHVINDMVVVKDEDETLWDGGNVIEQGC